jgi:hypothetical protein
MNAAAVCEPSDEAGDERPFTLNPPGNPRIPTMKSVALTIPVMTPMRQCNSTI